MPDERHPRRLDRRTPSLRDLLPAAYALVAVHVAVRGWSIWSSWFYADDFKLLQEGLIPRPGPGYLVDSYNGHLMAGGRLVAWIVSQSGHVEWELAAAIMLGIQAAASLACLWMLLVLFGRRWAILVPLVLYTTSALSTPSFVWWAASLNQTPLQLAFFCAVGAWVRHLRGDGRRWLVATLAATAFGLFFWIKAVLIVPVLAFLALGYFAQGGPVRRLSTVLRRYWLACLGALALVVPYALLYLAVAEDQSRDFSLGLVGRLADSMIGTAFGTAIVGGPWRWDSQVPPTAYVAPPDWSTHLAWVVLAGTVGYLWLRRSRTLRAWAMVAGYLTALLALVVTSRAPVFGAVVGLEPRFAADALIVTTLALGLATMPLVGAVESSEERTHPLLTRPAPRWLVVACVVLVAAGGTWSSLTYATYWHDSTSKSYLLTLKTDLDRRPPTDLVDQAVPEDVSSLLVAPANTTGFLGPLLSDQARIVDQSSALAVVGPDGTLRQALIGPGVPSRPGPVEGCGWRVTERGRTIPLEARAFDFVWWLRIGYLSSADSAVQVSAGGTTVDSTVLAGLNNLYVRIEGTFDEIRIDGLDAGETLCVDRIDVGPTEPGGVLP